MTRDSNVVPCLHEEHEIREKLNQILFHYQISSVYSSEILPFPLFIRICRTHICSLTGNLVCDTYNEDCKDN